MYPSLVRRALASASSDTFSRPPRPPFPRSTPSTPRTPSLPTTSSLPDDISKSSTKSRTVFVRPWDGIQSMAHAFAIVRKIEEKYGEIEEFLIPRDRESSAYQAYFWITFVSSSSYDSIGYSAHMEVPFPAVDSRKEGGVGLEDLKGLLKLEPGGPGWEEMSMSTMKDAEGREDGQEGEGREKRWMDIKIEKETLMQDYRRFNTPTRRFVGRNAAIALYRGFLSFSGFAAIPTPAMDGLKKHYRKLAEEKGFDVSALEPELQSQSYQEVPFLTSTEAPQRRTTGLAMRESGFFPSPSQGPEPTEVSSRTPTPSPNFLQDPVFTNNAPASSSQDKDEPFVFGPTVSLSSFSKPPAPPPLSQREKKLLAARMAKMVEDHVPVAGRAKQAEGVTAKSDSSKTSLTSPSQPEDSETTAALENAFSEITSPESAPKPAPISLGRETPPHTSPATEQQQQQASSPSSSKPRGRPRKAKPDTSSDATLSSPAAQDEPMSEADVAPPPKEGEKKSSWDKTGLFDALKGWMR